MPYSRRDAIICGLFLLLSGCARDPLPAFPRVMLWAWESAQQLDFINPREAGVAFLARTVLADNGHITVRPRVQPLRVANGTALMAVVRFETKGGDLPAAGEVAAAIIPASRLAGIRAIQVDFDAKTTEKPFYREVIRLLRQQLPAGMPLTITALASWCNYDAWITDLPITDATPMLFRMGPERYRPGDFFRVKLCQNSIGISTDEPIIRLPRVRRIYIFHPGSWSKIDYQNALQEAKRWL